MCVYVQVHMSVAMDSYSVHMCYIDAHHICVCMCVCMCASVCMCTYVCVHVCMHVCVYTYTIHITKDTRASSWQPIPSHSVVVTLRFPSSGPIVLTLLNLKKSVLREGS